MDTDVGFWRFASGRIKIFAELYLHCRQGAVKKQNRSTLNVQHYRELIEKNPNRQLVGVMHVSTGLYVQRQGVYCLPN